MQRAGAELGWLTLKGSQAVPCPVYEHIPLHARVYFSEWEMRYCRCSPSLSSGIADNTDPAHFDAPAIAGSIKSCAKRAALSLSHSKN